MEKRSNLQKDIRIIGFILFIPFMLLAGPVCGYYAGVLVKQLFKLSDSVIIIFVLAGVVSAVFEVIKIIKRAIRIENTKQKGKG